jgi:hypothetical protein
MRVQHGHKRRSRGRHTWYVHDVCWVGVFAKTYPEYRTLDVIRSKQPGEFEETLVWRLLTKPVALVHLACTSSL